MISPTEPTINSLNNILTKMEDLQNLSEHEVIRAIWLLSCVLIFNSGSASQQIQLESEDIKHLQDVISNCRQIIKPNITE